MIPSPNKAMLARRDVLKSLSLGAGSLLLAPLFQRLQAAEGQIGGNATAPRFLFVLEGSGMHPQQIAPDGLLKSRDKRKQFERFILDDKIELPMPLTPLASRRKHINILQGLSGRIAGGGHSGNQGALGHYNAHGGKRIAGPTLDCYLGQHFPGIFPSITLGISASRDAIAFNCSGIRKDVAQPTLMYPDHAFNRLFGSVAKDRGQAIFNARRNLLDFMADDIKRTQNALGQAGREQLDAYLDAYESLKHTDKRIIDGRDQLRKAIPEYTDEFTSESRTHRLSAQFKLASAAMIGGISNVVTIASGVGFAHFPITFDDLNVVTEKGKKSNIQITNKHSIGHDVGFPEKANTKSDSYAMQLTIRQYHFDLIAKFLDRLAAIPEGDGTMADNTVVVFMSDAAETHHSRMHEWPMVVVGDLKGKLRSNQMLVYPDYGTKGHYSTSCFFQTLLHASGIKQNNFGEFDPELDRSMQTGPLSALLS